MKKYTQNIRQKQYIYSKRIGCAINGEFDKHLSSAVCYAWFIWVKGDYNRTELKWIY